MRHTLNILLIALLLAGSTAMSQTPFRQDSALSYLRTIAVDIGPRTMGSPGERQAMEFALTKYRQFGLQETYIMPIKEIPGIMNSAPRNTSSGVAVGILKGKSDRMIILGAHADSDSPDNAGANDDGSGCAVIIELARILSQRQNESTIVFALFGGEEQGLVGSKFFVDHFGQLNDVVLMLQVDMANGSEWLMPHVDSEKFSSPEWLVRAAYEEFEKTGHHGLYYPTHFFALMSSLPGGGVGSDHEPFLSHGIPAIDFTTSVSDPIHTPLDSFENFKPGGLQRTGDLLYRLLERFDGGVPEQQHDTYYLVQLGTTPIFFPLWLISLFIVSALLISFVALFRARQHYKNNPPADHRKIPGLKLFLLMLIIQTAVWFSENIVGLLKGDRYPWLLHPTDYFILGGFGALIGIWFSLQLAPKLHMRQDGYSYFLRALIFLYIFFLLTVFGSVKLALYPAMAIGLLSLAMLVRQPAVKLFFWILSPHFMFRLLFFEPFDFIARMVTITGSMNHFYNLLLTFLYILFFSVWAFPFLLGFAAIRYDSRVDFFWLKTFHRKSGLLLAGIFFILTVIVLAIQPTFSNEWKQRIWAAQQWNVDSSTVGFTLKSAEYIQGTRITGNGIDTVLQRGLEATISTTLPAPAVPWIQVKREIEMESSDSTTSVTILLKPRFLYRPFTTSISYTVKKGTIKTLFCPLASSRTERTITLSWYSFPDTALVIPLKFSVAGTDSLIETLDASFTQPLHPFTLTKENSALSQSSRVTKKTLLSLQPIPRSGEEQQKPPRH
ncbi:MAG: M28 family metallopeptidase [bacterium]